MKTRRIETSEAEENMLDEQLKIQNLKAKEILPHNESSAHEIAEVKNPKGTSHFSAPKKPQK